MTKQLPGQLQTQCVKHNGPVNGMEPHNVLADHMAVTGPVLLELVAGAVRIVAHGGDIVGQGVDPHIDHMLGIEGHRDAPLEGGAGYAQILQAGLDEVVHHFLLLALGDDEVRMGFNVILQPLLILGQPQEVCLLLGGLHLSATVRTLAVHQLGGRPEALAGSTVHALILALVDIPLVVQLLEDLLYHFLMPWIRCADESVV
ncbi:uncharacterized protein BN633_00970 [Ruminococcus sp. CAG:379]|nr:uncharacterized protein BN633_00970 [Ruminococcus sp. CAG:379]